jgi:putative transposase
MPLLSPEANHSRGYVELRDGVCSRRILGWRVSTAKTTPLVMAALEQALFTRRRHNARFTSTGIVFHSDAVSPSSTRRCPSPRRCSRPASPPSIGTVGDALDNALLESTIGLFKDRARRTRPDPKWSGAARVERETARLGPLVHTTRIHHSIGKMSPIEFEELHELTNPAADPAVVA